MKTAISLPDTLYDDAEAIAKVMGIPRSQLFAKALEEFIDHHKRDRITERLNAIYTDTVLANDISQVNLNTLRQLTKNDTW